MRRFFLLSRWGDDARSKHRHHLDERTFDKKLTNRPAAVLCGLVNQRTKQRHGGVGVNGNQAVVASDYCLEERCAPCIQRRHGMITSSRD